MLPFLLLCSRFRIEAAACWAPSDAIWDGWEALVACCGVPGAATLVL